MAHGLNAIKREIDCDQLNSISVINNSSSLVGNSATVVTAATGQPAAAIMVGASGPGGALAVSGLASHSGAGNAKSGSRRIFTPQFKLQVLEAYRHDSECKGNQRATARKYDIHRRQIQKWLQCEKALRASVANDYSQNSVKHHQFHNITQHQMTMSPCSGVAASAVGTASTAVVAPTTPAPAIAQAATNTHTAGGAYAHNNNNLHHHHHHHQARHRQHQPLTTALDAARHSVALASLPPTGAPAAIRLSAAVAASSKCIMNGLPLIQPTATTNTMPMHQAYSQTPAIQPVPLISPHHHHLQSQLHQHHHQQLHHPQRQHENVLMPSACLPELPIAPAGAAAVHESLEYSPSHYENFHRPQPRHVHEYIHGTGAIDLSLGPRRFLKSSGQKEDFLPLIRLSDAKWPEPKETNNNDQEKTPIKVEYREASPSATSGTFHTVYPVDLTCRKRANHTPDTSCPPEKLEKIDEDSNEGEDKTAAAGPAKPVKLFKPYLPDNEDPEEQVKVATSGDQKDAIIWSNHPTAALSSPQYDVQRSNFQSPPSDSVYTFPLGSPSSISSSSTAATATNGPDYKFQSYLPQSSPHERITPSSIASSPVATNLLWCPKGSPVSGYDTASTYSDTSEPSHPLSPPAGQQRFQHHQFSPTPTMPSTTAATTTRYSLDVKVEPIDSGSYYTDLTSCRGPVVQPIGKYAVPHHHQGVQRWLLQQETTNHRPGIALYV